MAQDHLTIEKEPSIRIVEGSDYVYTGRWPPGYQGCRWRLLRFVQVIPGGQHLNIVECQEGTHAGKWIAVTDSMFALRFVPVWTAPPPAEREPDPEPEFRAVGPVREDWRMGI
jgi:hypothetical protein